MLLVTVDAYSKWIDVQVVNSATSRNTIDHLRTLFATHGIPEVLVSDNGTPFTSTEFTEFTSRNGIRHIKTAPYHPSSNGLAERAVKTVKEGLKKCNVVGSLNCQLARLLFQYRITPHSTTGTSPAELLFNRQIRSHLSQAQPDLSIHVESRQLAQKRYHDFHAKERLFQIGDAVFVKNFSSGPTWLSGIIKEVRGPVSYTVTLSDNRVVRKHVDQIRPRTVTTNETEHTTSADFLPAPIAESTPSAESATPDSSVVVTPPLRRSTRIRQPPDRFRPENFT